MIEPLAKPTLSKKLLLEPAKLAVEQIVGLVDQANQSIGRHLGRALLNIGPIGPIGPIARVSEPPDRLRLFVILAPEPQPPLAKKILIIQQQLLQARASNTDELELGFLGSPRRLTV